MLSKYDVKYVFYEGQQKKILFHNFWFLSKFLKDLFHIH